MKVIYAEVLLGQKALKQKCAFTMLQSLAKSEIVFLFSFFIRNQMGLWETFMWQHLKSWQVLYDNCLVVFFFN